MTGYHCNQKEDDPNQTHLRHHARTEKTQIESHQEGNWDRKPDRICPPWAVFQRIDHCKPQTCKGDNNNEYDRKRGGKSPHRADFILGDLGK